MLKLSFKDTADNLDKITFVGGNTAVSLRGTFTFPMQMSHLPQPIIDWMFNTGRILKTTTDNQVIIEATGYASLHPDDTFDPILGERIAEARAKLKLYKFMLTLTSKLFQHYTILQYGRIGTHTVQLHDINPDEECLHNTIVKYVALIRKENEHLNELIH